MAIQFKEDEQYLQFAEEFMANGGNMAGACEKSGIKYKQAEDLKRRNPEFRKWLANFAEAALAFAVAKHDARLFKAVETGDVLDAGTLKMGDQLYKRCDKIKSRTDVNVQVNNTAGLNPEEIDEVFDFFKGRDISTGDFSDN